MRQELRTISEGFESDDERLGYLLEAISLRQQSSAANIALLVAFTGLRFGEAAALRGRHLRLEDETLRIQVVEAITEVRGKLSIGLPKTSASRRSVPVPSGRVAGAIKKFSGIPFFPDDELLFTGRDGGLMSRTRYRARFWIPAVRFAGITPEPGFHDLRHSYAAWMVEQNVHPKRLQERLGHSSIRMTLDTYGHLMKGLETEGSDLDELLSRPSRGTYVARAGSVTKLWKA